MTRDWVPVFDDLSNGEIWAAGFGAALAQGVISAGVAVLVVRLTHRHDDKRAEDAYAREQLIRLIEAFGVLASTPVDTSNESHAERVTAMNHLVARETAAWAAIRRVGDDAMADRLRSRYRQASAVYMELEAGQTAKDAAEVARKHRHLRAIVLLAVEEVESWLVRRRPLPPNLVVAIDSNGEPIRRTAPRTAPEARDEQNDRRILWWRK